MTGVNAGSKVFGQDPLWPCIWANDLINYKNAGDMAALYQSAYNGYSGPF